MLILHYTATKTGEEACDWLCNPQSQVSCHYLIMENGSLRQLVDEKQRAWHAGVSSWHDQNDINSRSIGIEIQHDGDISQPYPEIQITHLIVLIGDILSRYAIPPCHILGHSDVAPFRKIDPGSHFPWQQLAHAGIGHYVLPHPLISGPFLQQGDSGQAVEALQGMLALYGYPVEINRVYDDKLTLIIRAFQMHFRPEKCDGIADYSTIATLKELLNSL